MFVNCGSNQPHRCNDIFYRWPQHLSLIHISLASNGWQKASSKVLKGGHAEHIHATCDCEFAIRFDHNTTVAGYDPEKYLAKYNAAGGAINKMRRVNYAANKEPEQVAECDSAAGVLFVYGQGPELLHQLPLVDVRRNFSACE